MPVTLYSSSVPVNVNDESVHVATRKPININANRVITPLGTGNRERQINSFIKDLHRAEHLSFRAVARVQRECEKRRVTPRVLRTLLDPGAELNLIRTTLLNAKGIEQKIKIHERQNDELILTNNGKEIGRVREAVFLSFTLDECVNSEKQTHGEWFHLLDNLDEEMILGAQFCKEQGFTSFHTRLQPWGTHLANKFTLELHKRGVHSMKHVTNQESVDIVDDNDKAPFESGEVQLLPDPTSRGERKNKPRDRIVTNCEKIQQHAEACAKQAAPETLLVAGRRRATSRTFAPIAGKTVHSNHIPVNYYKQEQTKQILQTLMRRTIGDQEQLYKQIKQLAASDVNLTFDEAETLRDTSRLLAHEAAIMYGKSQHLLTKSKAFVPSAKQSKYFLPAEDTEQQEAPAAAEPGQNFKQGQCVILQNLVTHHDLNNKPARIVNYDDETKKYVISIASPMGYWYASENKLRALDPPPTSDDFVSCGIQQSSGQPTLDPLQKPAHRQYGSPFSEALTGRIAAILEKYKQVFGKDISMPCKFKPMKIELIPGAILPRNPRQWKNSPLQRAEVKAQLQSFLDMNIVRPSETSVVSNVLLVKRPGMPGKFRFTIDFRDLNDATVAMPWQMPEVQNQLDRLAGNKIFGCIDLSSYYHQIELDHGSRFLTGFITEDGVFEYQRVPMGLKNACAHAQSQLQGAIDADPILSKYGLRNYFDDLPLAAKTEDEFCEQMIAILELGVREQLKFNLEKSVFGMDSITHVGFIVKADGIEVDPQRIESLAELEAPKSMKGLQSVLGVWNYIRVFIPNFSTRALPLTNMIGGKAKAKAFLWTDECQKAFDDLKEATLNTKLLFNIDYTKPIYIRCDSSQFGAGAVLFQYNEQGQECPISYASRKYTMAERNYCTFQQEAAAVVWSLEKFANFHQGHHVTVQSDHKNLSWIKRSAMPQLTRWRLRLQDFDFSLEYYEGVRNVVADGLSRRFVDDGDIDISIRDFLPEHVAQQSYLQGTLPVRCLNNYSVGRRADQPKQSRHRRTQHTAVSTKTTAERVWEGVANSTTSDDSRQGEEPWQLYKPKGLENESDEDAGACIERDVCGSKRSSEEWPEAAFAPIAVGQPELPVIPEIDHETPAQIMAHAHNSTVGHSGVLVTLNRVLRADKQWASRAEMIEQIDQFISGCSVCQKFRKRSNRQTDERFVIAGNPFSELSVDILKLPKRDCHGNLYVVVIVDSFSRWVCLEAVQDKSALSAARAILRTVGNFGVPLTIRSDGGKEFINDILASVEHILGTAHHKIMPYHHEGNSLAEKANRSVLENLRNLIFDKRLILNGEHQWSDLLPLVQRIMNASFNSSIGCAPAALVFGNNVDIDRCLLNPAPERLINVDVPEYVRTLTQNQRILLDVSERVLSETHAKNIAKWKREHKTDLSLQQKIQQVADDPSQAVWVLSKVHSDAPRAKWQPKWAGPYRLLDFKTNSQSVVRLYDTVSEKVVESHINDVALWDSRFVNSEEGLTSVAEADGWQYPIDGVVGIALAPESDDDEPQALPLDQARQFSNKHKYVFAVKWHGYAEPSWEPFSAVEHTSSLVLFAQAHPALKLVKH
jgi:hypothetical protein